MILADKLINTLKKNNISFFTGVPDSVLKNFSLNIKNYSKKKHVIATNEGSAVAIAVGHYLSKKKLAAVYMQNSGLGNAINPLASIAHQKVYSIPMLLVIGWRGAPGFKDEPQHKVKGAITKKILSLLGIRTIVIRKEKDLKNLTKLIKFSNKEKRPVACLIEKNTIINHKKESFISTYPNALKRFEALKEILNLIKNKTKIISTTGYTSRELNQIRKGKKYKGKDFYMVGGMGHAAMVALGNSFNSENEILCIDGDGSLLMHLGSLTLCNNYGGKNFKYILFNNNSHESVGGQTTNINKIDLKKLMQSFKFKRILKISNKKNIREKIKNFINSKGPSFLEIKIRNGTLKNLTRPKSLISVKNNFLKN